MKAYTMQVILMLLLLRGSLQECSQGCLKCSSDNSCEYCDFTRNYYLQNGSCQLGQIDNCETYTVEGQCLMCEPQYYLDNVTGQCLSVTEGVRIDNCTYYETENACMICQPQFYLNGLNCAAVTITIDNCKVYSNIDKCGECLEGYIIQHDQKGCLKEQDVDNCQTFTSVRCNNCKENYHLQNNYWNVWIQHLLKTDLARKEQRAINASIATKVTTSDNCTSIIPKKCAQLKDFQTCHICQVGYFLKEGDCFENPPLAIPFCEDYSQEDRCRKCEEGYRLTPAPQYKCKAVENVQFCIKFDGEAFETRCQECKERYYLKFDNLCEERTITVEFCLKHEVNQDKCAQCETGYQLTSDGKKCLQETPSCSSYLESDINTDKLICEECNEYHYLNIENLCTLGNTENCRVYERIYDQCRLCEDNYFLNADLQCEQHPLIDGCSKYDPYIKNRCRECQFDRFLLTLQTECQSVQVDNCRVHKTIDHCAECDQGYSLLNNGQCTDLDPDLHCLVGEYGLCIKCEEGYTIEQGICIIQLIYEKDVCQLSEMPIDYKSALQCTSREDLVRLGLDGSVFDNGNCHAFEYDEDFNYKCVKCADTFEPDQTGACVATASNPVCTDDTTFFYRNLNYKVKKEQENLVYVQDNICLRITKNDPAEVNHCKDYGISKGQFNTNKDVQYGCLGCQDATNPERQFQMVEPSSNRETLFKDNTNIFWKTDFKCELKNSAATDFTDIVWGDAASIDNCEYFQQLQHNKIGCMRCKNSFNGIIKNQAIDRCLEYDPVNLQCTKCQENYLLEDNNKKCTYYTSLTAPKSYATNCQLESFDEEKCYLCKDGFTLKDDGSDCFANTSGNPIANCAAHTHNSSAAIVATCEQCDDGYYLTADKQNCWQVANCKVPASATTCAECDLTYELNGGNTCVQVSNCDYNDLNSSDCLVGDTYNISTLNKCTAVTIAGCEAYDQVNAVCTQCENGKYLFVDTNTTNVKVSECVAEDSYPSATILPTATHTSRDCKKFGVIDTGATFDTAARYGCLECKTGYYFFDTSVKDLTNYNCIQNSYVDKASDDTDTNDLLLAEFVNNTNCDLYDFLQDECSQCKSGTAYWSSDYCCPLTEYYNGSTCVSINTTDYPDCNKLELIENQGEYECTNCITGTNELVDGFCKATSENCDHVSNGACIVKADYDCDTYDIRQNECTTCSNNHYNVPAERKDCCDDSSFIKSDGSCAVINTDLTIASDTDKQANMRASCIQYDEKSGICLKCAAGKTFTGRLCVDTDDLYENCSKIDNQTNLCEVCDSNYLLNDYGACCQTNTGKFFDIATGTCTSITPANAVTDCIVYSADAANSCTTCNDGFWNHSNKACCKNGEYLHNPQTNSDNCQYPSDKYQYCLLYEFDNAIKQQYKCQLCNPNYSSQLTNNSVETCCPHGKKPNTTTGVCEADAACKISKDGTLCYACPINKQLITDESCVTLISDCDVATDASECTQCDYGNIVDSDSSDICATLSNVNVVGKYNCGEYPSLNGSTPKDCTSCLDSLQILSSNTESCCPIGTYFKVANRCEPIPIDNCAVYDSAKDKCTKCVQDDDQCTVEYDFIATMGANLKLRYLYKVGYDDIRSSINQKYYLGNDTKQTCCKFGYYYNGTKCIEIETENCQEYDYKNYQCKECKNDYILENSVCVKLQPSQCSSKSDSTIYYNSNEHCCPQNKYWNEDEQLCEDIPDSNCIESNDGVNCTKCDTGKEPQSFVKVQYQLHYRATIDNCPHIHKHKAFYKCIPTADKTSYEGYTQLKKFEQIAENCKDVDFDTKVCNECLDGYYRPEGVNICCANGEVAVEINGQHYCRSTSTIADNCVNFDIKTNKCLQCQACNADYLSGLTDNCQLSGGMCCQRFKHFNVMTGLCENMLLGECQDVDLEAKMCRSCPDGYYFYHSGCVKEGYSFTDLTMSNVKTETVSGNGSVCLQKSPQGHCAVCDVNPGGGSNFYYNYKGLCVKQKTNDQSDAALTGAGFVDTTTPATVVCLELDSYDNCTKCLSGYFLIEGRCCKDNEYWSGSACVAPAITNCETADPTKSSEVCIECSGSNILLNIDKPTTTAAQDTVCGASLIDELNNNLLWGNAAPDSIAENVALAQIQSTINCVVFQHGECTKCANGFVLALKTIDISITSTPNNKQFTRCVSATQIPNCTYHDADNITQCIYCDGTKKLASNVCTGDALTHCTKSDAQGCLECTGNYLLRTESDWSSGSEVLNKTCWFNSLAPCIELDGNTLSCKKCAANYVLDFQRQSCNATLTALQNDIDNCISGVSTTKDDDTFECFICEKDFFLADSTTCTGISAMVKVDKCKVQDTGTTCSECITGYYVTKQGLKCCANGTIFYEDSCVDWTTLTKDNCTKLDIQSSSTHHIEKVQCSACATNYQLTNGMCCPKNSIGMERFCYTPTTPRSTNCKVLDNTGRCGECESTHYLTNGGCCSEGEFFDTIIEQCQTIADSYFVTSASNATVNCLRINDQYECIKCDNNGRLYNGICYDSGHSIDPTVISSATTTATNENFPNCTEVTDNVCTNCATTYSLGGSKSSDKCCGKSGNGNNYYYDSIEQKCKLISNNCITFDNDTNTCTSCDNTYYSTGLSCCQANNYFDTSTSACAAISGLTGDYKDNCQELTQVDHLKQQCSKCVSGFSLIDGICYNHDALVDNCSNKSSEDCLTCSSTNIISGLEVSVCCPDNQIFNATTKACAAGTGLTNCKNQLSTTLKCSECDTDYYLLNESTCCEAGKKPDGSSCADAVSIEHCVEWGTLDGDDICLTCKTGFQPYNYRKSGDFKTKCCANGTFLDSVSEECITKNALTNTNACDQFDIMLYKPYYKLPLCTDIPGGSYVSNNFVCTNTNLFNTSSSACETFSTTTYPNCNQVSDGKCLNCTSGNLIKGKCCPDGQFSDGSTACAASTANGLVNCKIFYEECPTEQFGFDCTSFAIGNACKECQTSNYLTYNYKCCPDGEYWDDVNNECKDYTSANVGDKHKSNIETNCLKFGEDLKCLSCDNSLTVSDDGMNCCASTSEFVNITGTCSDTYTIQTSCKQYDHTKYECKICSDGYYLTLGKCCADGEYYERSSNLCKAINAVTLKVDTQCNQYDEEMKCLGCNAGYEINFDQECIQVPTGCKVFDANTLVCDECNDNFNLSEDGFCCATDQLDSYGVCKVIETQMQINNCEAYFQGKCTQCESSHYLIQGECCPDETYYDRTSTNDPPCTAYSSTDYNNVANCKEYGYAKEFCDVCKDNYMLVRYLWGDKCVYLEPSSTKHIANCINYLNTYDSGTTTEQVKCTKCSFAVGTIYKLEDEATATTTKDILPELQKALVTECEVYHITSQFQASTFACIKCSDNFYLNAQNECTARSADNVAQCVGYKPLDKDECDQCDAGYYVNYLKQCEAITMVNCIHYDREKEVCLKCTDTLDVAAAGGYDQTTDDEDTTYRQMRLKYYLVNDYVRSKCSLEKHTPETFPDHYLGYIDSCTADASQTDKLAINLDNFYDKWYPVHFCTDNTKIPIAFVKAGEDYTGMPYGIGNYSSIDLTTQTTLDIDDVDEQISAGLTFDKATNFGKSTQCISSYGDVMTGQTSDPKTTPISNCAMIMTNVEMPFETTQGTLDNPDFSTLSTFCTACQTGYSPVRNGFLPIIINSCNSIANCDTSDSTSPKVLNGCPKCTKDTVVPANNYTFKVNDEGVVDYTLCVQTDDINCELLNLDNTCKYCKTGYLPNYDGKCALYRSPNCNDANFSFLKGFTVDNFEYVLAYLGTQKGCTECADGYKGLLIETKKLVCSQSTTLETQDFETNSTIYDTRCEQYGIVEDKAVCTLCSPGYLLNQSRKCILTSLENCSIVVTATECAQCSGEFILQNGNCVQQVIENCDKHNINQAGDPICIDCEDTYLLQNDICVKGPVENCRTYNDLPICTQCIDNYVLVTLKDGSQQCSAINQEIHPNCVQYKSASFNDNQVECITCSTLEFLPVYYEFDQDICLQLEVIDNCIKYDKEPLFVHSSLKCLECEQKYVLQNDKCEERKVTVEHCTEYSKYEHKCTECSSDYYLSADGIQCILEPSGIPNCDVYADYELCKHCKDHTYLYQNKCISVPTSIENCKYYKDSQNCALCEDGMILENNQCKEYKVTCLTYLNSTECATCPEGQGIKYENNKRICAIFNVVQYCDVHDQIEPYACKKCLSGYFLYNELPRNKCVRAITPVGNCVEYSGPEDCSLCAEGYLLSFDLKSCIEKTFNDNCSSRSEVQPYCVQCKSGYILNHNDECVEENSNLPEGCLGLDKNGNCHMCRIGYYQNDEKKCIKI